MAFSLNYCCFTQGTETGAYKDDMQIEDSMRTTIEGVLLGERVFMNDLL